PLDVTGFRQALTEYRRLRHGRPGRTRTKKSDHRHRLLRACRDRPGRRTAEQRDELAPSHSISSSASNWIELGTSMPSALAVFRWTTSSNWVGCRPGGSFVFPLLRIRPT